MVFLFDKDGLISKEWLKRTSKNDWSAGLLAFQFKNRTLFVNRDRKCCLLECTIVEKSKSCIKIEYSNGDHELLTGICFYETGAQAKTTQENAKYLIDKIYEKPLNFANLTPEELFELSENDVEEMVEVFGALKEVAIHSLEDSFVDLQTKQPSLESFKDFLRLNKTREAVFKSFDEKDEECAQFVSDLITDSLTGGKSTKDEKYYC